MLKRCPWKGEPWFTRWLHKKLVWGAFTDAGSQAPAPEMMTELIWGVIHTSPFKSSPGESQVLPEMRRTDPNFPGEHLEEISEVS